MEKDVNVNQHIISNSHGFVDLNNLSYRDNGNINWNNSVGAVIPFSYNGTQGELIYIERINSDKIKLSYNNSIVVSTRSALSNCAIGAIINPNFHLPRYNIGDEILGHNSTIKIINMFYKDGIRYYKYICLSCNYVGEIRESCLIKGKGCPCCAGVKIVPGINDFNTKFPNLAKFLVDKTDGGTSSSSTKLVAWYCPNCGEIIKDRIINVVNRGIICERCGDRFSFNENVMANILNQLNIEYIIHKNFDWAKNKNGNNVYYDFYIPSLNCIIETHGMQHYESMRFKNVIITAKQQQEIDDYKEKLAITHGVTYYIVLDCRYSKIEWMKRSIHDNALFCKLFDFNSINWDTVLYQHSKKCKHYNDICKMWNEGNSISEISQKLKIDRHEITKILKYATVIKDTNYSKKESNRRGILKCKSPKLLRPIKCVDTGQVFQSISLCKKMSQEILHVQINGKGISDQIKHHGLHRGLKFEYITCEEFNRVKKESPELAFGDSFLLEAS